MTVDKLCRNNIHRLLTVLLLPLLVCTGCEAGQKRVQQPNTVGAKDMITYPVGRFAIDIPAEMKLDHQGQTMRACEIEDFLWAPNKNHEDARREAWETRINEIKAMTPPKGHTSSFIESREIPNMGQWAKGVFYFRTRSVDDEGKWEILVDLGSAGVWFKFDGLLDSKEELFDWMAAVARSYQPRRPGELKLPPGNWFYTRYGAVNLPYLAQESTYAAFEEHPLGLELEIHINETHEEEKEGHNLLGRLAAVLATGYNAGVDVKKIRTGKRTVAGLPGEEIIVRHDDGENKSLNFMWRHAGKVDSGEKPEILIQMKSEDGQVDAKIKVWDVIVNSMQPLHK